jgi:hypothetical protein
LKRLVLTDQEEASDDSLSKKRRRTRSTGLPSLVLPSGSPSLVASPSSATTPSRSPLKIPAADSHAARASRRSTPSVDSNRESAKPKTKEIVIAVKNRPELAENLVVKRFYQVGDRRFTCAEAPSFLRFPIANPFVDISKEKIDACRAVYTEMNQNAHRLPLHQREILCSTFLEPTDYYAAILASGGLDFQINQEEWEVLKRLAEKRERPLEVVKP